MGDLVHDRRGGRVRHRIAHGGGEAADDLPLGHALLLLHHRTHAVHAALGVGEGAVLLEERGAREEHVREGRRLVEEQVLHDEDLQRLERVLDVVGVGIRLGDVLAVHEQALEGAAGSFVEHVGNAQARLTAELDLPLLLEQLARRLVGDVAVAGELVRERAHVARALHVVLAAQRVHADALVADVAGDHGEVGHGHDHGRALAVLGDAEAVVDGRVATGCEQAGGGAHFLSRNAGDRLHGLGRVLGILDELLPAGEVFLVAARGDEAAVGHALGDDDVRHGVEHGDVGAGAQLQVVVGLDVRASARCRCGADRRRSAWPLHAGASSCARRTPDGRRSGWRR